MLAAEVTDSAVQRQAGDTRRRDDAAGHREAEQLGLTIEVSPGRAALHTDGLRIRVDVDTAHLREVEHDSAVVDGVAGDVVPSGLDREHEALLAREVDRVDDVGCTAALHDQRRAPIDQRIPDRACLVIAGIVRSEHRPPNRLPEPCQRLCVDGRLHCQLVRHRFPPVRTRPEVHPSIRRSDPQGEGPPRRYDERRAARARSAQICSARANSVPARGPLRSRPLVEGVAIADDRPELFRVEGPRRRPGRARRPRLEEVADVRGRRPHRLVEDRAAAIEHPGHVRQQAVVAMHGALDIVDEDRPCDAELVS